MHSHISAWARLMRASSAVLTVTDPKGS